MTKSKNMQYLYIVFSGENEPLVTKYLNKIEYLYNIKANTLTKHFTRYDKPYSKGTIIVYKTFNIDLKSNNKGNLNNFISCWLREW